MSFDTFLLQQDTDDAPKSAVVTTIQSLNSQRSLIQSQLDDAKLAQLLETDEVMFGRSEEMIQTLSGFVREYDTAIKALVTIASCFDQRKRVHTALSALVMQ